MSEDAPERETAREVDQQQKLKKENREGLCDKDPNTEPNDARRGSSSPPPCPLGRIDGIVEKHLGDFSAEMQLVLQRESICYSHSEAAQVTTESTAVDCSLPRRPISQFSQYVSFYNPCPPVQDYVGSLQDNIESMLTELVNDWPGQKPANSSRNGDASLANKVSAFVSSIRASKEDLREGELVAADTDSCHNPPPSREGGAWRPLRDTPTVPSAASSASNAAGQQPPCISLPSHLTNQSSPTSWNSRETSERTISKPLRCTNAFEGDGILQQANCEGNFSRASEPVTEPSPPPEATSSRPPTPRLSSPPATALSSLISQLQPEVFHNLMDIIKDVRRNSVQFYLHSSEPEDQVYEEIKVRVSQHEAPGVVWSADTIMTRTPFETSADGVCLYVVGASAEAGKCPAESRHLSEPRKQRQQTAGHH